MKAALRATSGAARKLLVLDLDDTLWGGVVGDVGWQHLRLGGHDAVGEAFVAFQRSLLRLMRRGVVLAIVSKNTESVALEAIDAHPEMVLRRTCFAAWRINWEDKAANVAALVEELRLGRDAVVFIDDSPVERDRVRRALPEVMVPDWPADPLLYEQALADLSCFDTFAVSDEDRGRTRMYQAERARTQARAEMPSLDDYLASLGLVVTVEDLAPTNLTRAAQLLNKTNQMNLSTRRMAEAEWFAWSAAPNRRAWVFRVSDRFDDYGLTGIASVEAQGDRVTIVDFVLSCRVMGRGVEEAMLAAIARRMGAVGGAQLVVPFVATSRNMPMRAFLDDHARLRREPDEATYTCEAGPDYPLPPHILLK